MTSPPHVSKKYGFMITMELPPLAKRINFRFVVSKDWYSLDTDVTVLTIEP